MNILNVVRLMLIAQCSFISVFLSSVCLLHFVANKDNMINNIISTGQLYMLQWCTKSYASMPK